MGDPEAKSFVCCIQTLARSCDEHRIKGEEPCPKDTASVSGSLRREIFIFLFFLFFGCPMAYSDLRHSCDLHCSCGHTGSFSTLCQAKDQTCILVLQRCHRSGCTTAGIPEKSFLKSEVSSTYNEMHRSRVHLTGVYTWVTNTPVRI